MTLAEEIIKLLAVKPLDDDQIARALGIEPRQTVNQICRRLAAQGMLVRERGPAGKIINCLPNSIEAPMPPREVDVERPEVREHDKQSVSMTTGRPLWTLDISKTLLVLPCSSAKDNLSDVDRNHGASIIASLSADIAHELSAARELVRQRVTVDESALIPARHRYSGAIYTVGGKALDELAEKGAHIIILSGGYGAVLASESIGMYDTALKPSWWPNHILERTLISYSQRHNIMSVRAFASTTSPYLNILSRVRWREAGINDAALLSPHAAPGGMRKSPASIGEAISALRDQTLTTAWKSSYGLNLQTRYY